MFCSTPNFDELSKLANPLIELLRKSYDPHCHIIISTDKVQVVREEMSVPIPIKD